MNDKTLRKLIYSALFAALCCGATLALRFPTPIGGYIHAGDALVLLGAFTLGPIWGAFAAGLGSLLADLISGFALYAPASFVIKALAALIAAAILRSEMFKNKTALAVFAGAIAELFMVGAYFFYDSVVLKFGLAAMGDIPANLIQAVFAVVAGAALFKSLERFIKQQKI